MVKKTVNQDDVAAYHLFYADGLATPGSDLTFFDWPVPREQRGTRSIARTGLRVGSLETLEWWRARFDELQISHAEILERDGRATLDFEDPEGQRLSLINDGGLGEGNPWDRSPVPVEHQIRGLGPITISVPKRSRTDSVLCEVMQMRPVRDYSLSEKVSVLVYQMGNGGPAAELHVAEEPDAPIAQPGAGGAHHVAFRTTQSDYAAWTQRLEEFSMPSSGPVNRYYFQSLYFREPNSVLFELATDEPGFTADEPLETLGESLSLPPFLESQRAQIEAGLKPLDS